MFRLFTLSRISVVITASPAMCINDDKDDDNDDDNIRVPITNLDGKVD